MKPFCRFCSLVFLPVRASSARPAILLNGNHTSSPRAETSSAECDALPFNVQGTAVTHFGCQFRKLNVLDLPTPPDIDADPRDNTAVGNPPPTVCRTMVASICLSSRR